MNKHISMLVYSTFGAESFIIGAALSRVVLPDEPIEITQLLPKNQCDKWCLQVNKGKL